LLVREYCIKEISGVGIARRNEMALYYQPRNAGRRAAPLCGESSADRAGADLVHHGGRDRQHDRAYIRNMHRALRDATRCRSINSRALPAVEAQAWMMARAEAVGNDGRSLRA